MEERFQRELRDLAGDVIAYLKTGFREMKAPSESPSEDAPSEEENTAPGTSPESRARTRPLGREQALERLEREVGGCTRCRLHLRRRCAVPGEGSCNADILLVGEGPGEQEDAQGRPFVGRAGELLTKMLSAIQLSRNEVYITNIVKCRPPSNRNPLPDEVAACYPFLKRQIEIIDPRIILCLGSPAARTLLDTEAGVTKLRGEFHHYQNIPVLPTYHPAAVLRFPEKYKRPVWNDLKLLRDYYREIST